MELQCLFRMHNSPPPVSIGSQIDPVHAPLPTHFSKIHFNIILPSKPNSSEQSRYLRFPHQKPVCTSSLPHTCYMPFPSQSSWFDRQKNIWWEVQSIKLFIVQSFPLLLGPSMLLRTLFSNILSLRCSLNF